MPSIYIQKSYDSADPRCFSESGGNSLVKSLRASSWKKLFLSYKEEFLAWMDQNGIRLEMFNRLAKALEKYLETSFSVEPLPNQASPYEQFLSCVPGTYDDCDNISRFEQDMAVEAYAHIHLLERYRRTWDVLICLLGAGVLPMSDKGLEVLDVGTGPGPALYAVADFYQTLQEFAREKGYVSLVTPLPKLDGVELIYNMQHSMHNLSEWILSEWIEMEKGPFSALGDSQSSAPRLPFWISYDDFTKIKGSGSLKNDSSDKKKNDAEAHKSSQQESLDEQESYYQFAEGRHNLVIFSNFLTKEEDLEVKEWREALHATFRSLRHGGVALVMGGIGKSYPPIYQKVRQLAKDASLQDVTPPPGTIPCNYSDPYADRIKEHYTNIWTLIKEKMHVDNEFLASYTVVEGEKTKKIPEKLWNPKKQLKGSSSPPEFTLLVFRRSERPWNSTKKRPSADKAISSHSLHESRSSSTTEQEAV